MKIYVLAYEVTTPKGVRSTYASGKKVLVETSQFVAFPSTVNGADGSEIHAAIAGQPWSFKVGSTTDQLDAASSIAADDLYIQT